MTELPIPLEALDDCGAILGRRGAGKSATRTLLFEWEMDRGRRAFLIDPKGDSWGIRLMPDGSPSRFNQVPIFGGAHGDIDLSDTMGATLGRVVAQTDLSGVLDLSAFSTAGMRRFMRDFAEALFENNRAPLTLYVDEADQLAPQTVPGEMATLLHHMERLIRQGRQRGIFMWMLTQRPQVLNKNLLSQAETLIAMKMTTPHDLKAIRAWMEAHDPEKAKEVERQLSSLKVGEAFAWVPSADFLERVQFPLFQTYDSGRTPRHGEQLPDVTLEKLDMSAIAKMLAPGVEQIEGAATKPANLDNTVAGLRSDLDAMEQRALAAEHLLSSFIMATADVEQAIAEALDLLKLVDSIRFSADAHLRANGWQPPAHREVMGKGDDLIANEEVEESKGDWFETPDGAYCSETPKPGMVPAGPSPSVRKLLEVYHAVAPKPIDFKQAALLAGLSLRSSSLPQHREGLLATGKVEQTPVDGRLVWCGAVPAEQAALDPVELWARRLKPAEAKMLRTVARVDGAGGVTVRAAAALIGMSEKSSQPGTILSRLSKLGLVRKAQHNKFRLTEEMKI